ncbi:hypothetical protein Syun_018578 [Stephania yunnanensis]|uniref:Fe2OG dioxygenase domain-containing protein n=1 Tax=Stephania yunnanensis TaxID=152371 RepID=A0AAP0IUU6_9MAGN
MTGVPGSSTAASFTTAMSLKKMAKVPERFVLPPSHRPLIYKHLHNYHSTTSSLPVIDLVPIHDPSLRSRVIEDICNACKEFGFFQVINHGVSPSLMKDVVQACLEFFNLPIEEKLHLVSEDVNKPVRYGTSLNHVKDTIHFWRDFLKHYSNPLSKWIHSWPSNPPSYKEKMGYYAKAMHLLHIELLEAIFESLGLDPKYMRREIEDGSQVMAVNCYPACPEPEKALGMPPHSDYGCITILLQTCEGLEVKLDKEDKWVPVPMIEGALLVHLGDHMEILSNGVYKSVVHRVVVNAEMERLSIASLHSLALEKYIGPAAELVNEQNPKAYKESSFKDFLDHIGKNDIMQQRFIDTLKIDNP